MTLVGRARAALLRRTDAPGDPDLDPASRADDLALRQLERLNAEWQRIRADVAYYRDRFPTGFRSLEEFAERVPPTSRDSVREHGPELASRTRRADFDRVTGGSTSSPVRLPAWRSEVAATRADVWTGRGWYGLTPASRLFLLWGHSHLLGSGLRGWVNARRRELKDRLLGYRRFSAYDLRPEAMRRAAEALLRFRPQAMLGYSVALHRFARVNEDRAVPLQALGLGAVIGTGESFPSPDSGAALGRLFACPVAMEYGAVETGVVAHTHPSGGYRAFWRSYLLDAERQPSGHYLLRVTSLYPRCFPLVRYEIGDEIDLGRPGPAFAASVTRFERVVGRSNDYVELSDGAMIHSEAFSHALRDCAGVVSFQVVRGPSGDRIRFAAGATPPSEAALAQVRERLRRIHPELARFGFERVEDLPRTVAGKTRMVLVERDTR